MTVLRRKKNTIWIIGVSEGEEKEKGAESTFIVYVFIIYVCVCIFKEMIFENFLNLGVNFDIQVHEDNRFPDYFNPKLSSPRHIIIKLSKIEDRQNPNGSKGKDYNLQRNPL